MKIIDITRDMIGDILEPRPRDIHKGDCGRDLIIAGGAGMTGAAYFSAKSALRSGAGLVYSCTSEENFAIIKTLVPEAICLTWGDAEAEILKAGPGTANIEGADFRKKSYDSIAFGPGMGTSDESKEQLAFILKDFSGPLVIDADGLNCLAQEPELRRLLNKYRGNAVITPHAGEAARLIKCLGSDISVKDREKAVRFLASEYGVTAVLKGSGTLICDSSYPDVIFRNTTGNPGMATAGSGDVLTGVITALSGQGYDVPEAARAGVYLHGMAGDLAAADKGEYGTIASDILEHIPGAIKQFV
ncbi:MAG: NAD(P)H-hydrate dehydratase [Eubacteriales bacterium]|nr:NAD(P)H-hydrate dehydratase [Eubacteriales bacterium]